VKAKNSNRPDHFQDELDEGVSQDIIAGDILAELELTPEKNVAAPSDGSGNANLDEYDDDVEDFGEEFDMGSEGDSDEDEDEEPGPRRIDFKKNLKKSKNGTRGDIISSYKDRNLSYEISQVYLQSVFKSSIFHLRFLMMGDIKKCRFRPKPHGP
jgi:hypothetical protein